MKLGKIWTGVTMNSIEMVCDDGDLNTQGQGFSDLFCSLRTYWRTDYFAVESNSHKRIRKSFLSLYLFHQST